MREWIIKGGFVPSIDAVDRSLTLANINTAEMVRYLSDDYERFALASAESFLISKLECDACSLISWPILKLYYSAFFAAHAVMRSQGAGVIKIESLQAKNVSDFLRILSSASPEFRAGMYIFETDLSTHGSPVIRFTPHGKGSGVHEAFWKSFCHFLDKLSVEALSSGAADATEMVSGSREVYEAISGSTSQTGSWFSMVRNQINYQHKYSVWFPTKKADKYKERIGAVQINPSSSFVLGTPKTKRPVEAFIETSSFLACLNIEIAEFIAARSTKGGAFGQKWRRINAQIR